MSDLSMDEAWRIAAEVRAVIDMPDRATNESVSAEWAAIDAALLRRGIVALRDDRHGNSAEGHVWWVGQHENGHMTGRWGATQGEVAVCLSLHSRDRGPLRWLVPDTEGSIHRLYFPKPSSAKTNYVFPVTNGPIAPPVVETTLFDLLGDWEVAS